MGNFYEENYESYYNSTVNVDSSTFLARFAKHLSAKATILDLGCGSGRDLLWCKQQGFIPTGFEFSPRLAQLAEKHAKCPVVVGDFSAHDFSKLQYDAFISIGAFVHITHQQLPHLLNSTKKSLNNNGYAFITMKEGEGYQESADGRTFTLWNKEQLELIYQEAGFELIEWTRNVSQIRKTDVWLGHILRLGHVS